MADGRHLGKIEKLLYLSRGSSDFDEIWLADAVRPSWPFRPLKIWNIKNPRWRQPNFVKIARIVSRPRFNWFDEIWHADAVQPSWVSGPLKIWNFKTPRWRRPPCWKIEKTPFLGHSLTDFDEIWHAGAVRTSWPLRPLKIWNFKNRRWRPPPSWKIENWHISSVVSAISTKFGTMMQFVLLDGSDR